MAEGVAGIGKLRLYLETTVFNYYFDGDRRGHEDVVKLFEAIGAGRFDGYASRYVTEELERAQDPKRGNMLGLIERYGITILPLTQEVINLANLYVERRIIPEAYRYDSAHIAIASVYGLDHVVSYNFKHINRDKTKDLTKEVNEGEGYRKVSICTAEEVLKGNGCKI